jgi:hypothetical protein
MIALALEEPAQPFLREIAFDRRREPSIARHAKCLGVEVGAEDLDFRREIAARCFLEQEDADGIGLLSAGATGDPDPDGVGSSLPIEQLRNDLFGERLERRRIAKERRDRNQEIVEKGLHFLGILTQVGVVVRERLLASDLGPPADATQNGRTLVL